MTTEPETMPVAVILSRVEKGGKLMNYVKHTVLQLSTYQNGWQRDIADWIRSLAPKPGDYAVAATLVAGRWGGVLVYLAAVRVDFGVPTPTDITVSVQGGY